MRRNGHHTKNLTQDGLRPYLPNHRMRGQELVGPCPMPDCDADDDGCYVRPDGGVFCRRCGPNGSDKTWLPAFLKQIGFPMNGQAARLVPVPDPEPAPVREFEHAEFDGPHLVLLHKLKIPVQTGWRKVSATEGEARKHLAAAKGHRIGVVPSSIGCFVIDIDVSKDLPADERQAEVARRREDHIKRLGPPLAVLDSASSKGAHLWYRFPTNATPSRFPTKATLDGDEYLYSAQQVAQCDYDRWVREVRDSVSDIEPDPDDVAKVLGIGPPEEAPLGLDKITEDQAARLFEGVADDEHWLYSAPHGAWMRFDPEGVWRPDTAGAGERLRAMGLPLNSAGRYRGALTLAAWAKEHREWDTSSVLTVPGGHVDLKTGDLLPPDPERFATLTTAVAPEKGRPELWLDTLGEIFNGDETIIRWLQRVFGYMLTPDTKLHRIFYFYGSGGNGKSLVAETLKGIMGDYGVPLTSNAVLKGRHEMHAAVYAKLIGKRLAVVGEVGRGTLDKERVQLLSGGDSMDVQFMRGDWFQMRPQCKLLLVGNEFPRLATVDQAMIRRLSVLAFERTFKGTDVKTDLPETLRAEWGRILQWGIEGAVQYHARAHIEDPAVVVNATTEYLREENTMASWFKEMCCEGSSTVAEILASVHAFYDAEGIRAKPTRQAIGRYLKSSGVIPYKSGARGWNIGLKEAQEGREPGSDDDIPF